MRLVSLGAAKPLISFSCCANVPVIGSTRWKGSMISNKFSTQFNRSSSPYTVGLKHCSGKLEVERRDTGLPELRRRVKMMLTLP